MTGIRPGSYVRSSATPARRTVKRVVAWLGVKKSATRAEILVVAATVAAFQYLPTHPTVEILGWVILALLAVMAVTLGWAAWTLKRRRR